MLASWELPTLLLKWMCGKVPQAKEGKAASRDRKGLERQVFSRTFKRNAAILTSACPMDTSDLWTDRNLCCLSHYIWADSLWQQLGTNTVSPPKSFWILENEESSEYCTKQTQVQIIKKIFFSISPNIVSVEDQIVTKCSMICSLNFV